MNDIKMRREELRNEEKGEMVNKKVSSLFTVREHDPIWLRFVVVQTILASAARKYVGRENPPSDTRGRETEMGPRGCAEREGEK